MVGNLSHSVMVLSSIDFFIFLFYFFPCVCVRAHAWGVGGGGVGRLAVVSVLSGLHCDYGSVTLPPLLLPLGRIAISVLK